MSSYPPPPSGLPPYPPPYNRNDWKAQQRAMKQQARLQRAQARMQRTQTRLQMRAQRRGSIVGPLVILAVGIVFLLVQTGRLSWAHALDWYAGYWPFVMIGAGLILLAEWALDQYQAQHSSGPVRGTRALGGGVITLLVILAIVGACSRATKRGMEWKERALGHGFTNWDHAFGDRHDADDSVTGTIPSGGMLTIHCPHGDVTVTGTSDDGQVHVNVHKQAYAWSDSDAEKKESQLQPTLKPDGANVLLEVPDVAGGQADLTVDVPHNTMLSITAGRGDVEVSDIHANVTLTANHGQVDLNGINGAVQTHVNDDDESVSAHSVNGIVTVEGRAGDITATDITGPVTLRGDFFGTTHLEHINGAISFQTSRTQFQAARLDGEFEVATGPELQADQILGPVVLNTRERNITLDRVQGNVQITNRDGSVDITNTSPLGQITITNQHGSVSVGVPANAGFELNAQTKNGDIENDFGLAPMEKEEVNMLLKTVGHGGPQVKINTSDGDVTISKTTVAPLPPTAPIPPRITVTAPGVTVLSTGPKAPKAPKTPKSLRAPTTPPQPPAAPAPPSPGF
ncbi:DUF4097 family beta strand repeat-containing protein [Granulicella mallensis]|uniref:DUF4097 and DUF4098 domain-containing protein YvlB n=1 Tax=Granulicella mallensis TaxID=940614 RepID=A0A7W8EAV6_9BACT|nr:DUF4097 family beta strand repeat-containing protein [Granulicella mallensis]MBB5065192.1 DUF4097 and DUF4098 domain-containing protein YvlB [Granulicella mallensis]